MTAAGKEVKRRMNGQWVGQGRWKWKRGDQSQETQCLTSLTWYHSTVWLSGLINGLNSLASVCVSSKTRIPGRALLNNTEGQELINQTSIRLVKGVGGSHTMRIIIY